MNLVVKIEFEFGAVMSDANALVNINRNECFICTKCRQKLTVGWAGLDGNGCSRVWNCAQGRHWKSPWGDGGQEGRHHRRVEYAPWGLIDEMPKEPTDQLK